MRNKKSHSIFSFALRDKIIGTNILFNILSSIWK